MVTTDEKKHGLAFDRNLKPLLLLSFKVYTISIVFVVLAISANYFASFEVISWLWICSSVGPNFVLTVLMYLNNYRKLRAHHVADMDNGLTMNAQFYVHRLHELIMLLNGEGILQIIVLPVPSEDIPSYLITFVLGFVTLSLITYIQFSILPSKADDSVIVRSKWRLPILYSVWPSLCLSLIYLGIGLKTVLKNHKHIGEPGFEKYAWLLCSGIASVLLSLFIIALLNVGPYELIFRRLASEPEPGLDRHNLYQDCSPRRNFAHERILLFLLLIMSPAGYLVLPLLGLSSVGLLGSCIVMLLVTLKFVTLFVSSIVPVFRRHTNIGQVDGMLDGLQERNIDELESIWKGEVNDFLHAIQDQRNREQREPDEYVKKSQKLTEMLDVIVDTFLILINRHKGENERLMAAQL